jgi:hypothetical protein
MAGMMLVAAGMSQKPAVVMLELEGMCPGLARVILCHMRNERRTFGSVASRRTYFRAGRSLSERIDREPGEDSGTLQELQAEVNDVECGFHGLTLLMWRKIALIFSIYFVTSSPGEIIFH